MENVDAVVTGGLVAAVVDAAAGDNLHIAVFTDEEIVVYGFFHTGLRDDNRNVAGFIHRTVGNADIDARFAVIPVQNLNVLRGLAAIAAAVLADVEGTDRFAQHVRDFLKQLAVNFIFHHCAFASFVKTGQPPRVSARIWGRISWAEPRCRMAPSPTTITSSAREMMRS